MKKALVYVCLFLVFISCGNRKKGNKDQKTVFKYNESSGITSLDPAFSRSIENIWAVNQLFNGLVQMNDKLEVEPCIAKSWEIEENGLVYTFHLRTDVYFHDHKLFPNGKGRKVIANDFVNSFHRIIDKTVASPGAWIFNNVDRSLKSSYLGFVTTDDSTLQIFLNKPFPPFIGLLTMQYCSVVPQEIVDYYGNDFRNNPVGTGPFKFKIWNEGERLIMIKNDNYWEWENGERLPHLDAISISFIKDKQSAFLEFIKGNFDFMSGLDGSYKDDILSQDGTLNNKYKGKFKMRSQPILKTDYLGFLVDESMPMARNSPVKIKAVRQAINYGFDRQKIITYLRNGIGTAATSGFVPLGMPSFDAEEVKGYTYNPDRARELLIEAGYPEGKGMPEIRLVTTSMYLDLCEFIQSQLEEVGIKIKVEVLSPAIQSEMVARSAAAFFRKNWVADYADAENYLALFYSKNFSPDGPNYTHFSNMAYDKLYEKAASELNEKVRYEYYKQMDKIIISEAPIVPLYYDASAVFFQDYIKNLSGNAMNLLTLKRVKKEPAEKATN
jgi:oligopeptide transport system substrate-binding protein